MRFLALLFIFGHLVMAQEKSKYPYVQQQKFSDKYFSGEYLMYDCQDKHWVCGDKVAKTNCDEAVKRYLPTDSVYIPCFVVKKFKDLNECVYHNKKVVSNLASTRGCFHPKYKKKIILY